MNMEIKFCVILFVLGFGVSGCGTMMDAAIIKSNYSKEVIDKAGKVAFISESQAEKKCKYIKQISQDGVDYDLTQAENSAKKYLMLEAAKMGGDSVAITDRFVTKNKTTKKVNITASIYKCR